MNKRVLICRSNPISPDPRVEKIARVLSKGGYSVQLFGWDSTGCLPITGEIDGIPFQRSRISLRKVKGLWNLWFELRWQIALLRWLVLNKNNFDIIHACDFNTILPSLLCKCFWKKKIVYDIFDFYADMLCSTPEILKKIIRKIELYAINWADSVILADDSRRQQISGSHPSRLEVIYNTPEDHRSFLIEDPALQSEGVSLRIAYVGNIQIERGLLELLEVLRMHPEWRLDLAGFGGDQEKVLDKASTLPNVTWHGKVSYHRALQIEFIADVIIATYDPKIPNHRYSSPNKLFEAMMLEKPVIVARGTNIDRIVEHENCGLVVTYGDVLALEAALSFLQLEPAMRQKLGKQGREAYEKSYNWINMQNRLLILYQNLV